MSKITHITLLQPENDTYKEHTILVNVEDIRSCKLSSQHYKSIYYDELNPEDRNKDIINICRDNNNKYNSLLKDQSYSSDIVEDKININLYRWELMVVCYKSGTYVIPYLDLLKDKKYDDLISFANIDRDEIKYNDYIIVNYISDNYTRACELELDANTFEILKEKRFV